MTETRTAPDAAEVEAVASRLADTPTDAEHQVRKLLQRAPNDPRLILILASARRRLGAPAEALRLLQPIARAFPRAAHTQYELGVTWMALGHADEGLVALRRAVSLNRDLPQAWRAIGEVLFKAGDVRGADTAFAEHGRAKLTSPQLKAAADALADDAPAQAEAVVRGYLAAAPDDPVALRMLGETLDRLGRYAEAETALIAALQADDDFDGARFTFASVLFHQQKATEAVVHVRRLLAHDAQDPSYLNLLAACLSLVGDLEEVEALYRGLLDDYPNQPQIWLNYGHALRTIGRTQAAVDAYRRCTALAPELGEAYWALANLKVERFSDAEVAAMQAAVARSDLRPVDRLHLHYALGKALEDRGGYAGSFESYAAGAAIRRGRMPYSAGRTTASLERIRHAFSPALLAAQAGAGCGAADPIFVLGLPRSGSTLIEQILASHSQVEGTMELPDIGQIARSLGDGRSDARDYLDLLPRLEREAFERLGRSYLETTRVHRRLGRPFFVDKMPNNFQHTGLIHLILPNACIIDARRHPLGVGFSAFKQHFAQGQDFSYALGDIGRYYRDYAGLMAHFDAVLPGRVLRVVYEDLVEDTEAQVRRLLDHCGLAFEPACLKFYETERAVKTVSSEQVRRPIFRQGLDQWRNYEPWLGPLKAALGPALNGWRG